MNQQDFTSFYDTYAAKLWGLILTANLPPSQSEAILINTLIKAWQQFDTHTLGEKHFLTRLVSLANQEGLPIECIRSIPRKKL